MARVDSSCPGTRVTATPVLAELLYLPFTLYFRLRDES